MSINGDVPHSSGGSVSGSLYGAALGASDIWARLAGSPMLRPTTPSMASSLAIDRPIAEEAMMDAEPGVGGSEEHGAPPMLESVVHLFELPERFAYAYFERDETQAQVATPSGAVVQNGFPVRPRIVCASRIVWLPVLGNDGLSGHRFDFVDGEGEVQAHAEVFVSSTAIHRVALVHRMFTPTARASGLVDRHSLLEFNSPTSHCERLGAFLETLPPGQIYLPVNELAVGPDLEHAIEIDARHLRNPMASVAATVWKHTREQLNSICRLAIEASRRHNCSEFARTGLS